MNDTGPVPFRLGNLSACATDLADQRMDRRGRRSRRRQTCSISCAATGRTKASIQRASGSGRTFSATSCYSAAVPVGPPSLPYEDATNPGYTSFKSSQGVARADGVRRRPTTACCTRLIDTRRPTAARKPGRTFPGRCSSAGDPNDTRARASPDFQTRSARLSGRRNSAVQTQVPSQRDAPRMGRRFHEHERLQCLGPPPSGNAWRTILVGGLGAGGRAVYALDVTNPVAADRQRDDRRSRRSCGNSPDTNLGYVYDAPTLVKTRAYGLGGAGRLRIQQRRRQRLPVRAEPEDRRAPQEDLAAGRYRHRHRADRAWRRPRLRREPQGSVRVAGIQRRPQGQRVALRPLQSRTPPTGRRRRSRR